MKSPTRRLHRRTDWSFICIAHMGYPPPSFVVIDAWGCVNKNQQIAMASFLWGGRCVLNVFLLQIINLRRYSWNLAKSLTRLACLVRCQL